MNVPINSWTLIFLFAAAQGIFLCILLLTLKKGRKLANNILSLIILLFSLSLVYYVAYWTGYHKSLHPIVTITLSFVWLFGPLLLFYFKALNKSKPTLSWIWHFVPFVLVVFLRLTGIFQLDNFLPILSFLDNGLSNNLRIVFQLTHLFTYALVIYHYQKNHIFPKNISETKQRWMVKIVLFYAGFCLSYTSYYLLVWLGLLKIEYDYAISLLMSVFIYMTGYYGFKNPEILEGVDSIVKYERSGLSKTASKALLEKLLAYMEEHKPYINSELKLTELASQLDIYPHHLSQIINENLQQNFSDFVNQYRVKHAKVLLCQEHNDREKIINIAYDSGL